MLKRCAVLLSIALVGCPGPAPTPVQPVVVTPDATPDAAPLSLDQDLPRLALRGIAFYEDLVRAYAGAGTDCVLATSKMKELRVTYDDAITAIAKVLHDGRIADFKAALEPHRMRLDVASREVATGTTMTSCSKDRDFLRAYDALFGPMMPD